MQLGGRSVVRSVRVRARRARKRYRQWRDPVARRSRRDQEHLDLLLAFLLRPDADCIDVGAYRGRVLSRIVELAPNGRHTAYEPLPHLAERLRARFPSVDVRAAAVSDAAGDARFVHVQKLEAYSGLLTRRYPSAVETDEITVAVERLDDLPDDYVIDLLKIDVEGGEMGVLLGGKRLIARSRPTVVFEHAAGARESYGTRATDVFDFFAEHGMRIFDFDGGGPYSRAAFERESSTTRWNWVAH